MYYDYKSKIKALELERERLEYEKTELVFKLHELNEIVEHQGEYYWKNGDIRGGETYKTTRGSSSEISAVKDKIAKIDEKVKDLERRIEDVKINGPEIERKEKEDRKEQISKEVETAEKELQKAEQSKKNKFKEIKRMYRSKNVFVRMFKKITLTAPKWKEVKKLSSEEMEFIIQTGVGNTWKRKIDNSILLGKSYKPSGHYSKADRKKIEKSNWNDFCRNLTSKNVKASVKFAMSNEESSERRYEKYGRR